MADKLNGRDPDPGAVRATFAPGSASAAGPDGSAIASQPAAIRRGGSGSIMVDGVERRATLELLDPPRARLTTEAATHDILLTPLADARRTATGIVRVEIVIDGWRFEVDVESERHARLRERATSTARDGARGGPVELRAIIPGRVVSVDVAEGDTVEAGERLLVLEAMKMQNELRAARAGTIGRVLVGVGQTIELGELLLVIE